MLFFSRCKIASSHNFFQVRKFFFFFFLTCALGILCLNACLIVFTNCLPYSTSLPDRLKSIIDVLFLVIDIRKGSSV